MQKPKIAVVINTDSLDYDDRIRKECLALSKRAEVRIFATFTDNQAEEAVTPYGVQYKSFRLLSREKLPSGKFLFIKVLEFFFRVSVHLNGYDLIWVHNQDSFLFPLFSNKKKIIWDLHEIPARLNRPILRTFFNVIEKKSTIIIHANHFRLDYLTEIGLVKKVEKHTVVRNFPDNLFLKSKGLDKSFRKFTNWHAGEKYIYLQSLAGPARYPDNCISAVLEATQLKTVVIGNFDKSALLMLKAKFGSMMDSRIFFTGMVNQLDIPSYLRNALFSIILYNDDTPNCRFCESNRFYQALSMGIPVITGRNPPMAEIINKYKAGISMKSDGRDLEELKCSLKSLIDNYDYYKHNAEQHSQLFLWDENMINHSSKLFLPGLMIEN